MANSSERARHHPAVTDVLSTLADTIAALDDVQRHLKLEFCTSYPNHELNPVNLVARVERIQEEVSALKKLCRDLLIQKQELLDKMRAAVAEKRMTQRLRAASGLPPMSEADAAAVNSVSEIIDEWTAHVKPVIGKDMDDPNQIFFDTIF